MSRNAFDISYIVSQIQTSNISKKLEIGEKILIRNSYDLYVIYSYLIVNKQTCP